MVRREAPAVLVARRAASIISLSRPCGRVVQTDMPAPLPVALRFVRAAPNAVTLDFVPSGGKEGIERFELQYQLVAEVGDDKATVSSEWNTASSSLKSTRCTKSGLKSGATYVFRARACAYPDLWSPHGSPTEPIRTLLPELPADCSESLKVPSRVLAAQAEAAAAKAQREAEEAAAREAVTAEVAKRRRAAVISLSKSEGVRMQHILSHVFCVEVCRGASIDGRCSTHHSGPNLP